MYLFSMTIPTSGLPEEQESAAVPWEEYYV